MDRAVTIETILAATAEFPGELPVREAGGDQRDQIKDRTAVTQEPPQPIWNLKFSS